MIARAIGLPRLAAAVLAGAFALSAAAAAADQDDPRKRAGVNTAATRGAVSVRGGVPVASGAIAARSTAVTGAAWHSDNSPIPGARLRLRNIISGRIHAHAVANELGQFAFHGIETGTYLVELVSDSGRILTTSHTFTVAPGETVATFVRLGTRVPWFNGFFANAAAAISSTAATAGITAIAPESMSCVSPPCSGGSR